jgi:hypothetical protein
MPRIALQTRVAGLGRVIGIRRHGPGGYRLPDRITGPRDPRSRGYAPKPIDVPAGHWPIHRPRVRVVG